MYNGNVQQNPLCVESCVTKKFSMSPLLSLTIFDSDAISVLLRAHLCTAVDSMSRKPFVRFLSRSKFSTPTGTLLYSSIIRLYPQNPVFKIVHDESVKVYLPMYNGNVQQNPLCVESCVTKKFSMSPLFSSTIFDSDANSVLLRAHLCTAVDSMSRKPFVRFLSRRKFSTPTSTLLYSSIIRLYPQNPVFKIVHDESVKVYLPMYNGNVQQNPLCVESCVTKKFSMSPLFSSTIFDPDANSAVDSMRRKPFVRFFIKMQIQYSY